MKRSLISVLCWCATLVLASGGSASGEPDGTPILAIQIAGPGDNLLPDPSFEDPPGPSFYWKQNHWTHNDVEFTLDEENPHSDVQSLPPNTDPHRTVLKFGLKEENTFWLDDVSLKLASVRPVDLARGFAYKAGLRRGKDGRRVNNLG